MVKCIGSLICSIFFRSLLFFSFLLTFFINQQTLAQVVIEEEVVLDPIVSNPQTGIESISLTMPFYGNVTGSVNG